MESSKNNLAIPAAIVIAGALIAVAIYFVGIGKPATGTVPTNTVAKDIRGVRADDHIVGNPDAEIKIVEFSDPECPFCKLFHTTMQDIMKEYGASGKVAWVYRHWPIPQLHKKAQKEAEALECAAEQGGNDSFWKYTDLLYETTTSNDGLNIGVYNTQPPTSGKGAGQLTQFAATVGLDTARFEDCLASGKYKNRVDTDAKEAQAAGGQGTPHSIIIVGNEQIPLEGAQPIETVKGLIETLLNK